MSEVKKSITPMEHYNMSDFLRGHELLPPYQKRTKQDLS